MPSRTCVNANTNRESMDKNTLIYQKMVFFKNLFRDVARVWKTMETVSRLSQVNVIEWSRDKNNRKIVYYSLCGAFYVSYLSDLGKRLQEEENTISVVLSHLNNKPLKKITCYFLKSKLQFISPQLDL